MAARRGTLSVPRRPTRVMNPSLSRLFAFLLTAACLTTTTSAVPSSDLAFTQSLSVAEQNASGLAKLSAVERAALDAQISREITLARQGDVVAFAKSFNTRRTPEQFAAAGLATLSPAERAQLDAVIARAVAQRPPTTLGRFDKKPGDAVETTTYRPQIHGEVSLTYGTAGGGRSFYGGSLTAILEDPAHHLTLSFTYAEYHGKGLAPFDCCSPLACVR